MAMAGVELSSKALELGRHVNAEYLDRQPGFSQAEQAALGIIYEQYGDQSIEDIKDGRSPALLAKIGTDLVRYYRILTGIDPHQRQVVYVDFSHLRGEYGLYQPLFQLSFEEFEYKFMRILREAFRLPDRSCLNIEFTTSRPTLGSYTIVYVTTKGFYDTLKGRSDAEREQFVSLGIQSDKETSQPFSQALQETNRSHPELREHRDNRHLQLTFEHPLVRSFRRKSGAFAFTFNPNGDLYYERSGFGNRQKFEMVFIDLSRFITTGEDPRAEALQDCSGNNFERATECLALTAAHEVGHALGLKHPQALRWHYDEALARTPGSLMSEFRYTRGLGPQAMVFNHNTVAYFRYILGVASCPTEAPRPQPAAIPPKPAVHEVFSCGCRLGMTP